VFAYISVKLRQLSKAPSPIEVTEFPIVKEPVKPLHPLKALLPIEVTESGIVKEPVKPLHPPKAAFPM
jgi:hypothetical protein